ncbi:hypothetical protein [Hoeflea olei]|uniref:Pyridoxamine 5'-phosphate oxidase putative domain-containing protein n=1 Tax=Hoeflea olei TaxID=1480615 RepID=A0A1C1YZY1_9HYPH|nr:hypothetical protein [Hoeflea olei]OCW59081.1 hypothetical protein AWJ14_05105 [Hoeflea olei]
MLETDVARFIQGRVMSLIATRNQAHRPMIGRGTGARFDPDSGEISVLVSRSQWPEAVAWARPGLPISTTHVKPDDYQAYQIKGIITGVRPATAAESAQGSRYVAEMLETLGGLGVTRLQLSSTLSDHELVRVSFLPCDLFVQTPGPAAGRRLTDGFPAP